MILKQDPNDMISVAEKYITNNERSLFDEFFACFEKYCSDNNLIFIGTSAVNYMKKWDSPESFAKTRHMYSLHVVHSDPRKHVEAVAKLLIQVHSRHIDPRTISYLHVPANNEYDININMRPCFKIGTVPDFRGNPITKYIETVPGSSIWNENLGVKCMPASFILPVFLRSMYDENIKQSEYYESNIQFLLSKINDGSVTGSKERQARHDKQDKHHDKQHKHHDKQDKQDKHHDKQDKQHKKDKQDKQHNNHNGKAKHNGHHNNHNNHSRFNVSELPNIYKQPGTRENYVYDGNIEDLKVIVKKNIPYIHDIIRYYMYDMDDTFMAKYTFYDNDKKPIFSVFNCCDYHTVPISNGEVSNIAAARLRIIEANMLTIMESAGVGKFSDARKKCMDEFWDCMSTDHIYDGFIGICINWNLLKKQMQKYRQFKTPIYPAAAKIDTAVISGAHMHHYFALEM